MKRKLLGLLVLFILLVSLYYIMGFFNPSLPTKLTSANILKIKPGMTLEQVLNTLGRPLSIEALNGVHNIGCNNSNSTLNQSVNNKTDIRKLVNDFISIQKFCCEGNKKDIQQFDNITLVYTTEGFLSSYSMLWVHLDKSFKVNNVYAKEYEGGFFGDDPGIYGLGWAKDSTGTKYNQTKTNKWINKEKFYRCF